MWFNFQSFSLLKLLHIFKLYRLALWQGYRLYLQQFSTIGWESIKDVEHFKQTYFPDGIDTKRAPLTVRETSQSRNKNIIRYNLIFVSFLI